MTATPPPQDLPVLDHRQLAASAPDLRIQRLMHAAFVRQMPELLGGMGAADSASSWKAAAHKLRGACATLGGTRVAALLEHAEHSELAGDAAWRHQQWPLIEAGVREHLQALQAHLT